MNKTALFTLLAMALVILVGLAYIFLRDESEVQKHQQTPAAKALIIDDSKEAFTDLDGNMVNVNDHFGKVMIVSSWASWCPQCMEGLQQLGSIADEYQDREVTVLAINRGEDRYSAERYLGTVSLPGNIKVILDPGDHYFGASAGYAMPETVIYNEDGEVDLHQRGNVNIEEIRQHLNTLLE